MGPATRSARPPRDGGERGELLPVPAVPARGGVGDDRPAAAVPLRRVLRHCRSRDRRGHARGARRARASCGRRPATSARSRTTRSLAPGSWSRVPRPGPRGAGSGSRPCRRRSTCGTTCSRSSTSRRPNGTPRDVEPRSRSRVGGGYAGVEALGELEDLARDASRPTPTSTGRRCAGSWWTRTGSSRSSRRLARTRPSSSASGIEILVHTDSRRRRTARSGCRTGDVPGRDARVDRRREAVAARSRLRPAGRRRRPRAVDPSSASEASRTRAAGDAAAVPDTSTGGLMPPTAQHGLRPGRRLAANLRATIAGEARAVRYANIGGVLLARPLPGCRRREGASGSEASSAGSSTAPTTCSRCRPGRAAEDRDGLDRGAAVPPRPGAARLLGRPREPFERVAAISPRLTADVDHVEEVVLRILERDEVLAGLGFPVALAPRASRRSISRPDPTCTGRGAAGSSRSGARDPSATPGRRRRGPGG